MNEQEVSKCKENYKVLVLKYQKEQIGDTYAITPLMKIPSTIPLDDYNILWDHQTGVVTNITHK